MDFSISSMGISAYQQAYVFWYAVKGMSEWLLSKYGTMNLQRGSAQIDTLGEKLRFKLTSSTKRKVIICFLKRRTVYAESSLSVN